VEDTRLAHLLRILYYLVQAQRRLSWSPTQLRQYQNKRLRSVVDYAYRYVPYYHDKMRAQDITPDDIRSVDDVSNLPLVSKDEIRSTEPSYRVSTQKRLQDLKIVRTTGSSGTPFLVYIDGVEDAWRKAIYMRANIFCGQQPRDNWVVITAPHHFGDTTSLQRRLNMYAQRVVSIFLDVDAQIEFIRNADADILDGYSSTLTTIAKRVDREGITDITPRLLFGNAEIIDPSSRRYLERVFDAIYCDQYGCAELDRTAWQCPQRVGYHMDLDSVITEVVDEEGQPVATGERGEVVMTSLFNYSMPLLRYAVGDVAVLSSDECSCGVTFPMMDRIEGRADAFPMLPDGSLVSPLIFTAAMMRYKYFDKIRNYRFIQTRPDRFLVHVEKEDDHIAEAILAKALIGDLQAKIGNGRSDIEFHVEFVDQIPPDATGKQRSVESRLTA
jgi:phenylacetate-CoA ligase